MTEQEALKTLQLEDQYQHTRTTMEALCPERAARWPLPEFGVVADAFVRQHLGWTADVPEWQQPVLTVAPVFGPHRREDPDMTPAQLVAAFNELDDPAEQFTWSDLWDQYTTAELNSDGGPRPSRLGRWAVRLQLMDGEQGLRHVGRSVIGIRMALEDERELGSRLVQPPLADVVALHAARPDIAGDQVTVLTQYPAREVRGGMWIAPTAELSDRRAMDDEVIPPHPPAHEPSATRHPNFTPRAKHRPIDPRGLEGIRQGAQLELRGRSTHETPPPHLLIGIRQAVRVVFV